MNLKNILEHVGLLRNQLLIFVILGLALLNACAYNLTRQSETFLKVSGVIIHLLTVLIFIVAGAFYCWLLVRMPGTAMEREFSAGAETALKEHSQQKKKRRSGKNRNK